jgi:hypothetical protein
MLPNQAASLCCASATRNLCASLSVTKRSVGRSAVTRARYHGAYGHQRPCTLAHAHTTCTHARTESSKLSLYRLAKRACGFAFAHERHVHAHVHVHVEVFSRGPGLPPPKLQPRAAPVRTPQ